MSPENYLEADNFDAKRVEESFKKHHNTSHYSQTNFSILNMLTAYDKDQKREDLLYKGMCELVVRNKTEEVWDEIKHRGTSFDDLSVVEKARMLQCRMCRKCCPGSVPLWL